MEIVLGVLGPIMGVILFVLRGLSNRVSKLEEEDKITRGEVREMIYDRVDDLRIDIKEIREKIDRLFDLYIEDHKNKP